jgi:Protein of unknown function (DUF3126)
MRRTSLRVMGCLDQLTEVASASGRCRGELAVDIQEIRKIEAYMRRLFGNAKLRVVPRPKKDDSAEVYIGEEFIGVMFVDDEDEDRSYNFQMAILGTDLE